MASLSRKSKGRPRPQMNVTPLVDVVLVLLIIFMVVIPAMEDGVPLDLPRIANVDPEEEGALDPFVLSIRSNGDMFFEDQRLPEEGFEQHLREANQREPRRRIVLRGDSNVRYQEARELFAMCQDIGFPGVSLRVNQREGDAAEGQ